jgi:hypothetical protein
MYRMLYLPLSASGPGRDTLATYSLSVHRRVLADSPFSTQNVREPSADVVSLPVVELPRRAICP